MSRAKRIVCYAVNGSGLGHLTRLSAVARWLRRYVALLDNQAPEVLFLTSSDASDALANLGFAAFKLPSKSVAQRAELDKLQYRRLAKHFVWNTLGVFTPDLLVVDTFPSGSFDELFQVLDGPFKKGFIYRRVKPEFAARATFRSALGMYDTIVAPHGLERGELPLVTDRVVRHCGEVIQFEREDLLPPDEVRRQLGVTTEDKIVYLSAGGGGDPQTEQALASLVQTIASRPNTHLIVGAGPLYRGKRLFASNLTWFDTTGVWHYFGAVDAAISAAGYNTFHELLFAQVPTAFFAQPKVADDQAARIMRATDADACLRLHDIEDSDTVNRALDSLLDSARVRQLKQNCLRFLPENGARRCALELLRPLYSPNSLDWAEHVLSPAVGLAIERLSHHSSVALSHWLTTLVPQHQIQSVRSHPGLARVLDRLSPPAAQEVQALLDVRESSATFSRFETQLLRLLGTIQATADAEPSPQGPPYLADDVLKTLAAVLKKQPLEVVSNGDYWHWIGGLLDATTELLTQTRAPSNSPADPLAPSPHAMSVSEVLQLYRIFPRVVDATARESLVLFREFLAHQRTADVSVPEIFRKLQVMKISQAKLTTDDLRATLPCVQEEQR